jgi:urease accessory protein
MSAPDAEAGAGPLPAWLPALLQLASPTLPIGAFSYSQGLEAAAWAGVVTDEAQAQAWIASHWRYAFAARELPVVDRAAALLAAACDASQPQAPGWVALREALAAIDADFIASRDSAEARAETRQTGASLLRWLYGLHPDSREARLGRALAVPGRAPSAPVAYALCAAAQGLPPQAARFGWAYAWLENQVMAAVRIVPLGQSAGQRMLVALRPLLAEPDPVEPWSFAPLASVAAMRHERQYSRLFRS